MVGLELERGAVEGEGRAKGERIRLEENGERDAAVEEAAGEVVGFLVELDDA